MVGRRLILSSLRHLLGAPWQSALLVLGITLGVAVVAAVDLANESARRAFEHTMEQMTGRATHRVLGGPGGIPESLYVRLRVEKGLRAAPVVEGRVRLYGEAFTLLGLDPFSEVDFRPRLVSLGGEGFAEFLTRDDALALPAVTARRLRLEMGQRVLLEASGHRREVEIVALAGEAEDAALEGLLLADIATAQELLGRVGRLERIDLLLEEKEAARLAAELPAGLRLVGAGERAAARERLSRSFRINLQAMSLLALLVGAFLIYNAMTFSVLRRRRLLGTLRLLGVGRGQLALLVLGEALLVALVGSLLGLVLGIFLAQGLVQLVARTINDLYFTLAVTGVTLAPASLAKAVGLGVLTALLATLAPALEAARTTPITMTRRSRVEQSTHRALPWLSGAGMLAMLTGALVLGGSSRALAPGFIGLFLVITGYLLLVPPGVLFLSRGLSPLLKRGFGMPGRLAGRNIEASLSRTAPAVAALTLAVAVTVGMGIMVTSFRTTVAHWLQETLQGDLYLSIPGDNMEAVAAALPPALPGRLRELPGIAELSLGRRLQVETGSGPVDLLAIEMAKRSYRGFRFTGETLPGLWPAFHEGSSLLISEPLAWHRRLQVGDRVQLHTASGPRTFTVGGIFHDYGSERGMVVLAMEVYRSAWRDSSVSSIGLYLEPGQDGAAMRTRVRRLAASLDHRIEVRSSAEILESSLELFDRTFLITAVLRWLVMGVAFVGIFGAFLALMLERRRESAILRATGMLPGELGRMLMLQSAVLGLMAGLLALPLGWVMALLLIEVINKRAFGWSIQSLLVPGVFVQALLLAVMAALLAGFYPALKMVRALPATALRGE